MSFSSWLRNWKLCLENRSSRNRQGHRKSTARRIVRYRTVPRLERLEDRLAPATLTVNSTADTVSGTASTLDLREAILLVNSGGTATDSSGNSLYTAKQSQISGTFGVNDTIQFDITAASDAASGGTGYNSTTGIATITPRSALPALTNAVIINGYSQPGATPNTLAVGDNAVLKIDLDGSQAGSAGGLFLTAGNSIVEGLAIDNFSTGGILLGTNGGDAIEGNFIGLGPDGTTALGNNLAGIEVEATSNNTIGGTTTAARNIISGNEGGGVGIGGGGASGNLVEGNYIGTDKNGTAALGNGAGGVGIAIAVNNTIGGTTAAARNIISGNEGGGVIITNGSFFDVRIGRTSGNVVEGNYIGTDVTGTVALGNDGGGVVITSGAVSNNTVGGTIAGALNVISANLGVGVYIGSRGSTGNVVEGNYIGTDATGTAALGNYDSGVIDGAFHPGDGVFIGAFAANNTIGGTTAAARNVISGNTSNGVELSGGDIASGNVVEGNYIGTDKNGTTALGNGGGVEIESANSTIGGTAAGAGNVISANTNYGVYITGTIDSGTGTGNVVEGNYIGTDSTGGVALGNGGGVLITSGAVGNTVGGTAAGALNVIAFNTGAGVAVGSSATDASTVGDTIRGNSIYDNSGLGIDLGDDGVTPNGPAPGSGPNDLVSYPVLLAAFVGSATIIVGTMNGLPATSYTLDFYSNLSADPSGHGQGQTYLGSGTVTTDATGKATFAVTLAVSTVPGGVVSATATDPSGNTSEFATDITLRGPATFVVTDPTDASQKSLGTDDPTDANGLVSLRSAIAAANFDAAYGISDAIAFGSSLAGDTLDLSPNSPLELTAGSGSIRIDGGNQITISGNNQSQIFQVDSRATANITGLTLVDGSGIDGGAIYNAGYLAISNSTLSNNAASADGGGIASYGTLNAINTTISNNVAHSQGGALVTGSSATTTLTDCTLSGNSASAGGGIYNNGNSSGGSATLNNTIVADSTAGGDVYNSGNLSGSYDLIGDGSDLSSFRNSLQGNPLLAPLGNYGGPTETMALLPGSIAIDAGSNALVPSGVTTDQRGEPRIYGSAVDIGAFESQGFTLAVAGGNNQIAALNTNFAQPLTVTVTANNPLEPVDGGAVSFAAPSSGASATLSASSAVINGGSAYVTAAANGSAGSYTVNATASGAGTPADFSLANLTFAQYLQAVLPQSSTTTNSITVQASATVTSATVIQAINGLTNVTQPVTIILDLGGGTYSSDGVAADPPPNVNFVIQNGTLDPTYPALTVTGGQVSVVNCTLTTSGNAPTLVVAGGNVTLRGDDIVQSSTSYTEPAISVTGGTVDLGTTSAPGNNTLSVSNSGALVSNTTGNAISAVGDTAEINGVTQTLVLAAPSLAVSDASGPYNGEAFQATAIALGTNNQSVAGSFSYDYYVGAGTAGTNLGSTAPINAGTYTVVATFASSDPDYTSGGTAQTTFTILGPGVTALGSTLWIVGGTTTNDNVQVNAAGSSTTGSTGVKVQATLNGVSTSITYKQSFTMLDIFLYGGNDNVQLATTRTINATVKALNGNDNVQLDGGNSTVALGNGNDNIQAGNGNNTIATGNGNDNVQLGNGNNTVTLGNGNDNVQAGNGNNTITTGNGNDNVQVGNGNNAIVTGNGTDNIQAGNGDNLIAAGLGQHTVQAGNGSNMLIDGSVQLTQSGDSLRQVLDDWIKYGKQAANVANIRSRLNVTYNTHYANTLHAGSGLDWFWATDTHDSLNAKPTDLRN